MRKLLLSAVIILTFLVPASCLGWDSEAFPQVSEPEDGCIQMCISKCLKDLQKEAAAETGKCTNSAEFIEDVTVPDGTVMSPGEHFRKIWRLRNTGSCVWDRSYRVVSSGNFHMGGSQFAYLDKRTEPGETADIAMNLTAPVIFGSFESEYLLEDGDGSRFGITGSKTKREMPFWLKLTVNDPSDCSIVRVSPYAVWRFSDFDAVFRIKNNTEGEWKSEEVDVRIISGADYLKYPDKILIDLPESVKPGEAGTIIFDMLAPDFQGDSEITIQLLKENDVICTATNKITFL